MKKFSFFPPLIIILILFDKAFQNDFIPIKQGNGILNQPYNHISEEGNLFFIFLNLRHGARSPLLLKDRHNDILGGKWRTRADLTSVGIKQHYIIGKKNKERYSSFISEEYDPKEIRIYSTPFPRTIMSITSEILGFYNNNTYNNNFNYSDIDLNEKDIEDINKIILPPVQSFSYDKTNDKYERIFRNHFECFYMRNQAKLNWENKFEKIDSLIANFNNEFADAIGKEWKNINLTLLKTPTYFDLFCDVFVSLYFDPNNNYIIKKLEKYGKNITKMKDMCDDFLYKQFIYIRNGGIAAKNPFISVSPIVINILKWMKLRADKNNNFAADYEEPKFVIYSGHDSTLFQMQTFFQKCFNILVEKTEYASTQLLEVRKYNNTFYVEIYYNDKLKMNATLREFEKQIKAYAFSEKEIDDLCYVKTNNILNIFFYFLIFCLIINLFYIFWKVSKENKEGNDNVKVIQIA